MLESKGGGTTDALVDSRFLSLPFLLTYLPQDGITLVMQGMFSPSPVPASQARNTKYLRDAGFNTT